MNQSVEVNESVTLSWKVSYTSGEISQDRDVVFSRHPQNNSSTVVQIGTIAIVLRLNTQPFVQSPFKPRIVVVESPSAISEPAITIQDVTKQDEAFYRIEVKVGATVVVVE